MSPRDHRDRERERRIWQTIRRRSTGSLVGGDILPPEPPPSTPGDPDLPQSVPSAAIPTVTGTIWTPTDNAGLQAALDGCDYGDGIRLPAGAVFTGAFVFPFKSGWSPGQWVYLYSEGVTSLPDPGPTGVSADLSVNQPRVYPQRDLAHLATIRTNNSERALRGGPGASGLYCRGIRFELGDAFGSSFANYRTVHAGYDAANNTEQGTAWTFNQCVFTNTPTITKSYKHLRVDVDEFVLVNSHFYGGGLDNGDANSIFVFRSRGPGLIDNNFICHNGENILVGGSDLPSWFEPDLPSDYTVTRNRWWKDRSWFATHPDYAGPFFGVQGGIKNIFEMKFGKRWLIEDNILDGSAAQGQNGQGFTIKTVNQGGNHETSETAHITIRRCLSKNVGSGAYISSLETPNGGTAVPVNNVLHEQSVWLVGQEAWATGSGRGIYMSHRDYDHHWAFRHCTIVNADTSQHYLLSTGSGFNRYLTIRDCVFGRRSVYGFWGADGEGQGNGWMTNDVGPTGDVENNVLVRNGNTAGGNMPNLYTFATHHFPLDDAAAGLNADGTLTVGSPLRAGQSMQASDATDNGCDMDALAAALTGVEIAGETSGYTE